MRFKNNLLVKCKTETEILKYIKLLKLKLEFIKIKEASNKSI